MVQVSDIRVRVSDFLTHFYDDCESIAQIQYINKYLENVKQDWWGGDEFVSLDIDYDVPKGFLFQWCFSDCPEQSFLQKSKTFEMWWGCVEMENEDRYP